MLTGSFIEFLFYIIPGFIYLKVFNSFHPAEKQSAFFEIANATAIGVLIHIVTIWGLQTNTQDRSIWVIGMLFLLGAIAGIIGHLIYKSRFWLANKYEKLEWMAPDDNVVWKTVNSKYLEH